ncbi:MAG: hypothetical protein PVG65_01090, partial [Candidatus Thorarchaeota archaeon]
MPLTIDEETKQIIRSPFDISNMSKMYKTTNEIFTFQSPSLDTIENNLYFLLRNSKEITFDRKYRMRPDYLSYDEYGTVILDQLLMYVNNVFSPEDFDLATVIIPSVGAVVTMLQDNFPEQDQDQ